MRVGAVGECVRGRLFVRDRCVRGRGGRGTGVFSVSNPQVRLEFRQKVSLLLCTSSNYYKGTVEWRLQAIVPNFVPNVLL